MAFEYNKVKSAAKLVTVRGEKLRKKILDTTQRISKIVGDTLGPGGRPILIERFEHAMPPQITKDGVTVFNSLGFQDPTEHNIMDTMRDCSTRTGSEAGDGTTTATVLGAAFYLYTDQFCEQNPSLSPGRICDYLEAQFRDVIEPTIRELSRKVDASTAEGRELLLKVAKISANGDEALANKVMECYDLVGDGGNVTITESAGPSGYEVEKITGYPVASGYENSCGRFYTMVINDSGGQRCVLDNPVFLLYNGELTDINTAYTLLTKVGREFGKRKNGVETDFVHTNVVVFATSFSEQVMATFCTSFTQDGSVRILPIEIPKTGLQNSQNEFLKDVAAITGATVFDPISRPIDTGELYDLGPGVNSFECHRYRCSIVGNAAERDVQEGETAFMWENAHVERIAEVEAQLKNAVAKLDRELIQERLGKLAGSIARLRICGPSTGELKEKAARADDAVCAVRGAIKYGFLPGGGWTLLKLCNRLPDSEINNKILKPALMEPVYRLLFNLGWNERDVRNILTPILEGIGSGKVVVYNAATAQHGDPVELGVLDSTPAVLEAIRNSMSIGRLLGTLGGIIVQGRDEELERTEAKATQDWLRHANVNEADERA